MNPIIWTLITLRVARVCIVSFFRLLLVCAVRIHGSA
jgi:hypothetical protein